MEHDNGTGTVQSEINIELSRINLGLPLICKVNSTALDAPITRKIHVNMEVAPNQLIMERPHDREATQADVPEGGRLSVTCIAKGAKPQAYIYWNSNPELNKVCNMIMMKIFQFPMRTFSSDKWVGLCSFSSVYHYVCLFS